MNRVTLCIIVLFILALALSLPGWLAEEEVKVASQIEEAWFLITKQLNYAAHCMIN